MLKMKMVFSRKGNFVSYIFDSGKYVSIFNVILDKNGLPDPDLNTGGGAAPSGVSGFHSQGVKAVNARIKPLQLLPGPDKEYDITRIGYGVMDNVPFFSVDGSSPLPYQEVKEHLLEVDAAVREMFPGYGVVYRDGDPRCLPDSDFAAAYREKQTAYYSCLEEED